MVKLYSGFLDDSNMIIVEVHSDSLGERGAIRLLNRDHFKLCCPNGNDNVVQFFSTARALHWKSFGSGAYGVQFLNPIKFEYYGYDKIQAVLYYARTLRHNIPYDSLADHLYNIQGMFDRGLLV